jgi:hypothetical protein
MRKSLNGSLAIVAVGVILGIIGFVWGPSFLLIFALILTVLGGGIPFFHSLQSK